MDLNISGDLKVAVLMGAVGSERQVSLTSGKCVADALRKVASLEVIEHDFLPDKPYILDDKSIDIFFLVFHGEFGEGGDMQEICERKRLLFTGCDSKSSRIAFDKMACKKALQAAGVPTPPVVEIRKSKELAGLNQKLNFSADGKFVVKPIRNGSSVGVQIVTGADSAAAAAEECYYEFGDCMIEKFITGREITVGIVDDKVLPVIEIRTSRDFYNYDAKYNDDQTQYLFDTIQDEALLAKINNVAMKSFKAVGCRDFSRIDLIIGGDGVPYVIEINTIPGFTSHSLLPKAAAKTGMDMTQLCMRIIQTTLRRKA
ncbi:MAG: D-alanine--D-alanine ligase [Planctomycetaceae bacterium]|nr:D-alanine--D-alanine ligase [Planctomycetaceae bacterium]